MASATTGRVVPRLAAHGAIVIGVAAIAASASAIEFADGRVQIHGFGEVQLRALDEKFREELDLAQWYNVLNVEFEFDLAPDGFGPFDLASAYARVEARYDAIYSEGFSLFPSINTFGNDAERLPLRLRDAVDKDYAGTIRTTDRFGDFAHPRIENQAPAPLVPLGERLGFPGYDTFFRQNGPDDIAGPNPTSNRGVLSVENNVDDPAWYVHEHIIGYQFAFKEVRGTANTDTAILGPWLPRNFVRSIALNPDKGNPFRGRVAPTKPREAEFGGVPNPDGGVNIVGFTNFRDATEAVRFFQDDPAPDFAFGPGGTAVVDRLDPLLAGVLNAPDTVWAAEITPDGTIEPLDGPLAGFDPIRLNTTFPTAANTGRSSGVAFGGDFLGGNASCLDPTSDSAIRTRTGDNFFPGFEQDCVLGSVDTQDGVFDPGDPIYTDPQILGITKMSGGGGENPFRPAPDVSNLGRIVVAPDGDMDSLVDVVGEVDDIHDQFVARGLYVPSQGTLETLESGRLDKPNMNFREHERAFNRGDSQNRSKELKEAYVDLEMLDSRLWLRLGLQNIVWGKTELFRTTDQFNPQDLALASLPSLEESRIGLWSARAVYSLYNVGPLEDVRLEAAANIDQYQNADLGACGEPFTPDVVCGITTGLFAHGLLGIGIVGIDRPESPWKEPSDLEIGGRIEWRWDRFSFALTDFYGFSDFPYPEAVFFYERAVDLQSGRPLVARLPGQSLGTCRAGGQTTTALLNQTYGTAAGLTAYSTSYASHPLSVTTGMTIDDPDRPELSDSIRGGIGTDPGCLRPGGPPGAQNALVDFDDAIDDDLENTNALEHHYANQQIFAWICAGTVGIAATLDPSACAWTIFSTPEAPGFLQIPFSEAVTIIMAGTQSAPNNLSTIAGNQKYQQADVTAPLVSLNALFNDPTDPLLTPADCLPEDAADPNCHFKGFDGFDGRLSLTNLNLRPCPTGQCQVNFQTLDNSLTNEQRALLGCGPFYGTRCDSSETLNNLFTEDQTPRHYARAGGMDFLNMEASALLQAWPGFEGTTAGHTTWARLPTSPMAVDGGNIRQQPGTVLARYYAATTEELEAGFPVEDRMNRVDDPNTLFGPACTRFAADSGGLIKLPGCRGILSLDVVTNSDTDAVRVEVEFEQGYLPSVDGCVIGDTVVRQGADNAQVVLVGASAGDQRLQAEFPLCSGALRERALPEFTLGDSAQPIGPANPRFNPDGTPNLVANPLATGVCQGALFGQGDPGTPPPGTPGVSGGQLDFELCRSQVVTLAQLPMIHPVAGCIDSDVWFETRANNLPTGGNNAVTGPTQFGGCEYFYARNLVEEFFDGTASLFQNELAAFSWNMLMFLTTTSCNQRSRDLDGLTHQQPPNQGPIGANLPIGAIGAIRADPQCFDAERPWSPGRCSYASPQFCSNVKGFLSAAGVRRNVVRAGGNGVHGRRTFLWHGGGEVVLTYEQRNVFGFSMDFAEDATKTNWGVEFTWIEGVPFTDNSTFNGITRTDAYNLTVSVDRPTFINFLNPNRTFFLNSQWFFNYLPEYHKGFTSNGPLNILFTAAIITGYFQDRVLPQFIFVYDINSQSGGFLPSMQYRFTEAFSATVGMLYFFGRGQMKDMPINEFGPPSNRAEENIYDVGVENGLSLIRKRDEVFLRLRWTF